MKDMTKVGQQRPSDHGFNPYIPQVASSELRDTYGIYNWEVSKSVFWTRHIVACYGV